jgi:hypothetical protein
LFLFVLNLSNKYIPVKAKTNFTMAKNMYDFSIALARIGFASVANPDEIQYIVATRSNKVKRIRDDNKYFITLKGIRKLSSYICIIITPLSASCFSFSSSCEYIGVCSLYNGRRKAGRSSLFLGGIYLNFGIHNFTASPPILTRR